MKHANTSDAALSASRVAGIILAAGKGTRMLSATPKVLHKLAGLSMLEWVFRVTQSVGVSDICIVLSEELDGFRDFLNARPELSVVTQKNRQGTGDAAASAAFTFANVTRPSYAAGRQVQGKQIQSSHVLLMAGDVPAIDPRSLKNFVDASLAAKSPLSVLGMDVPQPKGYGRLVTDGEELLKIVEEKDADAANKKLTLCNTGVIFAETALLFELLAQLKPDNAQKEYYLTDTVKHCRERGLKPRFYAAADWQNFAGINDRLQLATVEELLVRRKLEALMLEGVTIRQPSSCYADADVKVGRDSELQAGVRLFGNTVIGSNCVVAANAVLKDTVVGDGAIVGSGSVLEASKVASREILPPVSVRIGLSTGVPSKLHTS